MNKYLAVIRYELKNIVKDSLSQFMLFYPIIMLIFSTILVPIMIKSFGESNQIGANYTIIIMFIVLLGIGSFAGSIILGFSLIENKDENTLRSIAVTPLNIQGYLTFKIVYTYLLSIISNCIILFGTKAFASSYYKINGEFMFASFSYQEIVLFSLFISLLTPAIALLIASIAKNKVEGFAYAKASGLIVAIPLLLLIPSLNSANQYFLGIFPNFWLIKGLMVKLNLLTSSSDLSYSAYIIIGSIFSLLLTYLSYRLFLRKEF
jgi:fluoroquinolone transport system permease protein